MNFYQFLGETEDEATYFIEQGQNQKWVLWFNGKDHLSLHCRESAREVEFDTAKAVIEYCGKATDEDPQWAYFRKRVFRGKKNKREFPTGLSNRDEWVEGGMNSAEGV